MRFIFFRGLMAALVGLSLLVGPAAQVSHAASRFVELSQGRGRVCQPDQRQKSGAVYRFCVPSRNWNGELVVFAHGFVSPTRRIAIPEEQLTLHGISLPSTVTTLGYAFAVTSYSVNGLAIKEGMADVIDLVALFRAKYSETTKVYLMGFSAGALITTLALEQSTVFDGGLAACGPVGDFAAQINHVGDFRLLFDYFFPKLLPGSAISVSRSLVGNFDGIFNSRIAPQLTRPANAISLTQLLAVSGVTVPVTSTLALKMAIRELLWYNVHSTADGIAKLNGQPFDNIGRVYKGSRDDVALNARVQRFAADKTTIAQMQGGYTPSGRPHTPLVTLHTVYDSLVPYQQAVLYRQRLVRQGRSAAHVLVTSKGYGHCGFSVDDMQEALSQLQQRVQE